MSPIRYTRSGSRSTCRIGPKGRLSIPQNVLDKLNWKEGDRFDLFFTRSPVIIHLTHHPEGYILRYLNAGPKPSGGLLTFRGFTNEILSSRVILPKSRLKPISVPNREGLTLMLSDPSWVEHSFSAAGSQNIGTDRVGVYQICDRRGRVLRIGQGFIRSRINEHLKNEPLVKKAKTFQYAQIDPEADTEFVERVLLARFVQKHGKLPEFNPIQA